MALNGLSAFERFALAEFLAEKRLVFVKAVPWTTDKSTDGSKIVVQIIEDRTNYGRATISNFGEQLTVKMRNISPDAFSQLKPLQSEVFVKEIERASVFGDFRNQLSIIASISTKETSPTK